MAKRRQTAAASPVEPTPGDAAAPTADQITTAVTAATTTPVDDVPVVDADGNLRGDLAATNRKLAAVRAQIKALEVEEKGYVADLRAADLPEGELLDGGVHVLTVSRAHSWNADLAATVIPTSLQPMVSRLTVDADKAATALADGVITDEQWQAITTSRLDAKLAEANLPPVLFERCKVPATNPTLRPA